MGMVDAGTVLCCLLLCPVGTKRTLHEFATYCGVDFVTKQVVRSSAEWITFITSTRGHDNSAENVHLASDFAVEDQSDVDMLRRSILSLGVGADTVAAESDASSLKQQSFLHLMQSFLG
jgi:hypothetical protein